MHKNKTGKNLKSLMSKNGINQPQLSRETGIPQPTIGRILSGEIKAPKVDVLIPLCSFFKVSIDEIVGYTDVKISSLPMVKTSEDIVRIPMLAATAGMGVGISTELNHDLQIRSLDLTKAWIKSRLSAATNSNNIKMLTGLGDSMKGTYNHGDVLFIDIGITETSVDAVYAISHSDELFIKRIQRLPNGVIKVISDNKNYDPFVIENGDREKFRVIGRVIGCLNFNDV